MIELIIVITLTVLNFGRIVGFLDYIFGFLFAESKYSDIALLTLTNDGYIDITMNCIKSLEKLRKPGFPKIIVYAIGEKARKAFSRYLAYDSMCGILTSAEQALSERQTFRKGNWGSLTSLKFLMIHKYLHRYKFVCMTDGDIVFLSPEIFTTLESYIGDQDMLIMNDTMDDQCSDNLCSGFMFIRSNETTLRIFDPSNVEKRQKECGFDDQVYMNEVKDQIRYKMLPLNEFPNGRYFYNNSDIEPMLVHFNWTRDKLQTMDIFGMRF